MEEKKCTGNCIACSFQQQVYCAAQHGHAIMNLFPAVFERLDRLEGVASRLANSTEIINPLKDVAQNGTGAENRAPVINNPFNNGL